MSSALESDFGLILEPNNNVVHHFSVFCKVLLPMSWFGFEFKKAKFSEAPGQCFSPHFGGTHSVSRRLLGDRFGGLQ
jgi:hypothetical protein